VKRSNNKQIQGKYNITFVYRLTAVLILISILVSGVFAIALKNKKGLIAFSDNMFLTGVLLLIISIVFNLIKSIYAFKKKELLPKGQVTPRAFLVAGIINILISVIFALSA